MNSTPNKKETLIDENTNMKNKFAAKSMRTGRMKAMRMGREATPFPKTEQGAGCYEFWEIFLIGTCA